MPKYLRNKFHTITAEPVKIGSGTVDESLFSRFTIDETFDVGYDTSTPVSEDYEFPFDFTGTLNNVTIELTGNSNN